MNISKKALMSFLMALTSLVSMAQPYYHVMKRDGINQTEEAVYNAKNYKIRVDMGEPRPKDAIGGKITLEGFSCEDSPLKRSFYFTKHGNVYYNKSEDKFYFEKSQLDYPSGRYNKDHIGHFFWDSTIKGCTELASVGYTDCGSETTFYFANPDTLPRLQDDLGNERWGVLSACEWEYVIENLGEYGWTVEGETCYLIDTTPGKSLLTELRNKNNGNPRNLPIDEFKSLEAQGLVCLPISGSINCKYAIGTNIIVDTQDIVYPGEGFYWSCTSDNKSYRMAWGYTFGTWYLCFGSNAVYFYYGPWRHIAMAVRLVVLAD